MSAGKRVSILIGSATAAKRQARYLGLGVLVLLAGCGPEPKPVELRYTRPAAFEVSASVRKLAIAEFGGQTPADKGWGDIASDVLASELDKYNRKFSRYELVDRKRLKAIMDERDLQLAISDTSSAAKAGKLANVDAMIYGNVKVIKRDEQGLRPVFDPLSRSMKTVPYTTRYCMASVNFTLDDINTSKTLCTVTAMRDYDSEKEAKSGSQKMAALVGLGGDKLPPSDKVVGQLIEQCVAEFLSKISPHEVVVKERLAKCRAKGFAAGNKLAEAGDYKGALEIYQDLLKDNPDDDGLLFNAGLMCEAAGDLKQAESYYDRAYRKNRENEQYVIARRRAQTEGTGQNPPGSPP